MGKLMKVIEQLTFLGHFLNSQMKNEKNREWIVDYIKRISNADPDKLSEYIIKKLDNLKKKNETNSNMKKSLTDDLRDFFGQPTAATFVNELLNESDTSRNPEKSVREIKGEGRSRADSRGESRGESRSESRGDRVTESSRGEKKERTGPSIASEGWGDAVATKISSNESDGRFNSGDRRRERDFQDQQFSSNKRYKGYEDDRLGGGLPPPSARLSNYGGGPYLDMQPPAPTAKTISNPNIISEGWQARDIYDPLNPSITPKPMPVDFKNTPSQNMNVWDNNNRMDSNPNNRVGGWPNIHNMFNDGGGEKVGNENIPKWQGGHNQTAIRGRGGRGGRGGFGRGGMMRVGDKEPEPVKSESTLLVANLDEGTMNLVALGKHFQKFGVVSNITVKVETKMAFVQMSTKEAAMKALHSPMAICGNRFIKVFWAKYDPKDPSVAPIAVPASELPPPVELNTKYVSKEAVDKTDDSNNTPINSALLQQKKVELTEKKLLLLTKQITMKKAAIEKLPDTDNKKKTLMVEVLSDTKKLKECVAELNDLKQSTTNPASVSTPTAASSVTKRLDNRPKSIYVGNVPVGINDENKIKTHFSRFDKSIDSVVRSGDGFIVSFLSRKGAEKVMRNGSEFAGAKLELKWNENNNILERSSSIASISDSRDGVENIGVNNSNTENVEYDVITGEDRRFDKDDDEDDDDDNEDGERSRRR